MARKSERDRAEEVAVDECPSSLAKWDERMESRCEVYKGHVPVGEESFSVYHSSFSHKAANFDL